MVAVFAAQNASVADSLALINCFDPSSRPMMIGATLFSSSLIHPLLQDLHTTLIVLSVFEDRCPRNSGPMSITPLSSISPRIRT